MSNGMLDAYLICQALGWDWNLTSMILIPLIGLLIVILIIGIIIVIKEWVL